MLRSIALGLLAAMLAGDARAQAQPAVPPVVEIASYAGPDRMQRLIAAKERGAGGGHIRFNMARGSIASHISQFPVGTYKKAHAHGPGAHVIVLSGEGYSLMWPEGEEPRRYDWQVGTLIVPPNAWFHQHFNSGPTPARYLAFKHWSPRNAQGVPMSWISTRIGGTQVDYADESPRVKDWFASALAKNGLEPRMSEAYKAELPDLPPKRSQAA